MLIKNNNYLEEYQDKYRSMEKRHDSLKNIIGYYDYAIEKKPIDLINLIQYIYEFAIENNITTIAKLPNTHNFIYIQSNKSIDKTKFKSELILNELILLEQLFESNIKNNSKKLIQDEKEIDSIVNQLIQSNLNKGYSTKKLITFIQIRYFPAENYFKKINLIILTFLENYQLETATLILKSLFTKNNNFENKMDLIENSISTLIPYIIRENNYTTNNKNATNLILDWLIEISTSFREDEKLNFNNIYSLIIDKIIGSYINSNTSINFNVLINVTQLFHESIYAYQIALEKLVEQVKNIHPNNYLDVFLNEVKKLFTIMTYQEPPKIILDFLLIFESEFRDKLLSYIASDLMKMDENHFKSVLSHLIYCLIDKNEFNLAKNFLTIGCDKQKIEIKRNIIDRCTETLVKHNLNNDSKLKQITNFIKEIIPEETSGEIFSCLIVNILNEGLVNRATEVFKIFFIDLMYIKNKIETIKVITTNILYNFINNNKFHEINNNPILSPYETAFNWLDEISLVLQKPKYQSENPINFILYNAVIQKIILENDHKIMGNDNVIFFKTLSNWISINNKGGKGRYGYEIATTAIEKQIREKSCNNKYRELFLQKMVEFLIVMIDQVKNTSLHIFLNVFLKPEQYFLINNASKALIEINKKHFKNWLINYTYLLLENKSIDETKKWLVNSCKGQNLSIKKELISCFMEKIICSNIEKNSDKTETSEDCHKDSINALIYTFDLLLKLKIKELYKYAAYFLTDFINKTLKNKNIFPFNKFNEHQSEVYNSIYLKMKDKDFKEAVAIINNSSLKFKDLEIDQSIYLHLIIISVHLCEQDKNEWVENFLIKFLNNSE
jgi:hypothetical protein